MNLANRDARQAKPEPRQATPSATPTFRLLAGSHLLLLVQSVLVVVSPADLASKHTGIAVVWTLALGALAWSIFLEHPQPKRRIPNHG